MYVWDFEDQETSDTCENAVASIPDLILEGHEQVAAYALDWSNQHPKVASGGEDKQIMIWNISDYFNTEG